MYGVCVLPCGRPAAGGVVCAQTSPATSGLRTPSLGGLPGAGVKAGGEPWGTWGSPGLRSGLTPRAARTGGLMLRVGGARAR